MMWWCVIDNNILFIMYASHGQLQTRLVDQGAVRRRNTSSSKSLGPKEFNIIALLAPQPMSSKESDVETICGGVKYSTHRTGKGILLTAVKRQVHILSEAVVNQNWSPKTNGQPAGVAMDSTVAYIAMQPCAQSPKLPRRQ